MAARHYFFINESIFSTFFLILLLPALICSSVLAQEHKTPDTNLHLAVLQGNLEAVSKHIAAGTDLNEKDQFGSTPLIIAALFGQTEIAKELIQGGSDLNISSNEESTPLHMAALMCRTEIIRLLIDNGADKYLRNINGSTAYDIAAVPFEQDKKIYDQLKSSLGPIGLKVDYGEIKKMRPVIAQMLRPSKEELRNISYKPLQRDDWAISSPQEEGLDPDLIAELYNDASHLETIYSLLVIKNGKLIAEKYFNEGSIEQLSKRASVTKSYISAMLGIALNKGYIKNIDTKMLDFFPETAEQITDERKKDITVRDMLQMRAGYPWEETDTTYWNAVWSGEYISKIENVPLTKDPGTEFQYSNLTSNWLGIIISRACGKDLLTFGDEYLFEPLNVKLADWIRDVDGYHIGSGDMQFTARDMAKFGQLYLDEGKYNGKQIVPADWIKESLQTYSENVNSAGIVDGRAGKYLYDIGYGYQWWSASDGNHRFNLAWGHGGQFIILLHDQRMIIVVTSDPFYGKKKHFDAWRYEKSNLNVVGKFIKNLPGSPSIGRETGNEK